MNTTDAYVSWSLNNVGLQHICNIMCIILSRTYHPTIILIYNRTMFNVAGEWDFSVGPDKKTWQKQLLLGIGLLEIS